VFVHILPGKAVTRMTYYTVSGRMLNPTHSLTHSPTQVLTEPAVE